MSCYLKNILFFSAILIVIFFISGLSFYLIDITDILAIFNTTSWEILGGGFTGLKLSLKLED